MKESVVTDSACLIGLEGIGRLDLLAGIYGPVLAPPAVTREFGSIPEWLELREVRDTALIAALRMVVDEGEAEAIALASESRLRIVLDDRKARSAARQLGIPLIGTVGLIIRAKEAGLIAKVRPLFDDLAQKGFHVSDSLREEALRLAGE